MFYFSIENIFLEKKLRIVYMKNEHTLFQALKRRSS